MPFRASHLYSFNSQAGNPQRRIIPGIVTRHRSTPGNLYRKPKTQARIIISHELIPPADHVASLRYAGRRYVENDDILCALLDVVIQRGPRIER